MGKYLSIVVLLVVMVVVVATLCDAQDSNNDDNNNSNNNNNNNNNRNRNRSNNRRVRERGRSRNRGNSETPTTGGGSETPRPPRTRPSRPSRPGTGSRTRPGTGSRSRGNRRRGNRGRRPHSSCEEIHLPMCKGLVPYTHTKLPNRYNHTTQVEVYRVLEHMWSHMDHSCSRNLRLMICSLYLPKCHGRGPGLEPCKRTCMTARRKCSRPLRDMLGVTWADRYSCEGLVNRRCLRPVRDTRCPHRHPTCVENNVLSVCANLTFTWGTMPNMFQQCQAQEINTEIQYYDALMATRCHDHLNFLLCGVYSPFCVRDEMPFTFPCRELCVEIRAACETHYRRLYHNLPWPNKLQCHRYPSTETEGYNCVMPNEGANYMGGK